MKIYLAGKMDEEKGAWRNCILDAYDEDSCREKYGTRGHYAPKWHLTFPCEDVDDLFGDEDTRVMPWPIRDRIVLGQHDYTGPYRQQFQLELDSKHLGWFHGSETLGNHGCMEPEEQRGIANQAFQAIVRSDMVFAVINDPEAWGTVFELGLAAMLGKYIHIVIDEFEVFDSEEFWFVGEFANGVSIRRMPSEWGTGHRVKGYRGEERLHLTDWQFVRDELRDAIVAYAAKRDARASLLPVRTEPVDDVGGRIASEVFDAFRQIAQWTSDPRVRGEADRMVRYLAGQAVGRKR